MEKYRDDILSIWDSIESTASSVGVRAMPLKVKADFEVCVGYVYPYSLEAPPVPG